MRERIKYLDSIRGIACLIVLCAHIVATDGTYGMYASGCGKIGVWLFMCLSGMLLVLPYVENDNHIFEIKEVPRFYIKKLLRICPAYWVALLFGIFINMIRIEDLLAHLLLQTAWGHFWYMPVIIKFYVIAPLFLLVLSLCKKYLGCKGIWIFFSIIIVVGFVCGVCFPYNTYIENSISIIWYIPVFIFGMMLAILIKQVACSVKAADILAVFPIMGILALKPAVRQWIWGIAPSGYLQNKYIYMAFMWCCFIFLVEKGTYLKRGLEHTRILKISGNLSYEIYLVHYLILHKLVAMGISDTLVRGALTIVLSFAMAFIMQMVKKIWNRLEIRQIFGTKKAPND